ncbi:MAG TPA: tyrosine-protein phosphatase [Bryobacteraceae bacterium]|nr:tyrosine-protein phosphatase [Bryobacteraceae bacterium]
MRYRSFPAVFFALLLAPVWAANTDAPGVPNFHKVDDHVFRGGQPVDVGWNSLAHLGIKLVIDLRLTSEHPVRAEEQAVKAAGMQYVNVPMRGLSAPAADQISKVLALLLGNSSGPVFVHCRRGADRTGTVIAVYRIVHDHWANQKALQEARSYGMARVEWGMMHYIQTFKPPAAPLAAGALLTAPSN